MFDAYPFDRCADEKRTEYSPTMEQWIEFWRAIERANVWQWRAEYFEPILDGTSWHLEILCECNRVDSRGINGYPGGEGSSYATESEFAQFLRAMGALSAQHNKPHSK